MRYFDTITPTTLKKFSQRINFFIFTIFIDTQPGFGIAIKTVYLCIDMNDLHQTCIIVYCASSSAIDKQYIIVAKELGRKIALRNCAVVCGAGR